LSSIVLSFREGQHASHPDRADQCAAAATLTHQLAIEAIKSGAERLSDDAIDQWQPMTPNERLFA
jgi:hypothetical protein